MSTSRLAICETELNAIDALVRRLIDDHRLDSTPLRLVIEGALVQRAGLLREWPLAEERFSQALAAERAENERLRAALQEMEDRL